MLKSLLNFNRIEVLGKDEQKSIVSGTRTPPNKTYCVISCPFPESIKG